MKLKLKILSGPGTASELLVPMRGLGDVVASVAQPVARAIDSIFGTTVQKCGGCKARQDTLNKAVPFNQ